MIPIEELIRPISSEQLFDKLLGVLELAKIPARSWRPGGVARSILGGIAEVGAQGSSIFAAGIAGCFLLLGKGDYLKSHAKDAYDVDKIEAGFATGKLTLTNNGGAVFTIGADQLIARASSTKKRFRITEGFTLGVGGSVTVSISAIEPGSASSMAPGEIDELETPLNKVTVSNAGAVFGRDAETDSELVRRCMAKRGTWSPFGPRDAYEYAALSATLPDGSPTNITRVAVSRYSSTGRVTVVCATPSGTPTDEELDAVRVAVEKVARPDTVTVLVEGAVQAATAHSIVLWCRGGTEALIRARANTALSTVIATYPIGGIAKTAGGTGYLFADKIAAAVIGSSEEAYDLDFVGGAVDIALAANAVPTNTTTFDVRITT